MQNYHLQNKPEREITSDSEIQGILNNGKYAVISLCRENEPYIVTLSYGYDSVSNSLYFHCATKGLKLDFLKANPNVCATIIEDGGYVINECGHNFRSVVFQGKMNIVSDSDEKKHGMKTLVSHLEKNSTVMGEKLAKSDDYYSKMEILRLDIIQIQGKAGR